ncbi:hypothetical protein HDU67_007560 [Dinochytrium kinnereticum]|nr:hypothetical protein HDU67_007560 [Dinochytrium kinnereticum]
MYKNMQDALRQANTYIEELKTRAPALMPSVVRQGSLPGLSASPNSMDKSQGPQGQHMTSQASGDRRNPGSAGSDRRRNANGHRGRAGNDELDEPTVGRGRRDHPTGGRGSQASYGVAGVGGATPSNGASKNGGRSMSLSIGEDGNVVSRGGGPLAGASEKSVERRLVFAPNGSKVNWRTGAVVTPAQIAAAAAYGGGKGDEAGGSVADNPLYKTRLCERFETEGACPYGSRCTFAHGTPELRDRATFGGEQDQKNEGPENPLYKTRLCERFVKENFCQYGPRCNFAHSPEELRTRPTPVAFVAQTDEAKDEGPSHTTVSNPLPPGALNGAVKVVKAGGKKNDNISLKDLMNDRDKTGKKNLRVVEIDAPMNVTQGTSDTGPANPSSITGSPALTPASVDASATSGGSPATTPSSLPATSSVPTAKYSKLEETLVTELFKYFKSAPEGGRTITEETKEITRIEFKHDLTKQQLFNVLLPSLFDDDFTVAKFQARVKFFQQYIRSASDQIAFLKAWDKAMQRSAGLLKKAAVVFKSLYDADLVEEDSFMRWCQGSVISEGVKKRCEPLIEWFQTAEEEDD